MLLNLNRTSQRVKRVAASCLFHKISKNIFPIVKTTLSVLEFNGDHLIKPV